MSESAPVAAELTAADISPAQFDRVAALLYRLCGIDLKTGKEGLVRARLAQRLRTLGLASFDDYFDLVEQSAGRDELVRMIDALTTNKTSFFRESRHFDFLREQAIPTWSGGGPIRIWSAGCSSGEEPYSLAILLREELKDLDRRDVKILATDISTTILSRARDAVYQQEMVADVPAPLLQRHFSLAQPGPPRTYRVNDRTRALVKLARLNLMESWPMQGPFDAIFCRNVMIYFDKPTQQRLVRRFWELLRPGGHLFVGHSESLTTASREFRYVQPAVYAR